MQVKYENAQIRLNAEKWKIEKTFHKPIFWRKSSSRHDAERVPYTNNNNRKKNSDEDWQSVKKIATKNKPSRCMIFHLKFINLTNVDFDIFIFARKAEKMTERGNGMQNYSLRVDL